MKVRDLKLQLEGVDGDVEVVLAFNVEGECSEVYMHHVRSARFIHTSAISNAEFCIDAGEGYQY